MYASAMQSRFVVPYTVAFTIVIHVTLVHALSPASGDFNCSAYNPFLSQNMGTNCLSFLDTNPGAFEECRDETKTTTCYIFIEEPPFIIFNKRQFFDASPSAASLQTPFRCGLYASQFETQGGIEGMAFELHNMTSSANDLCMWGGAADYCSFNQLVDYIDIKSRHGYRFGITGLLLEIPQRHCRHEASAAIVDNSMVILSKVEEQDIYRNPIRQLTRPLSWTAWVVVGVTILLLTAVCLTIAIRLHFFRKRSLVTAFFISTGQNDLALQYEEQTGVINEEKAISFATRYSFSMALFRYALIGFFAIFILFYQAAIVNFLFQQEKGMKLKKRFKSLTVDELRTYSVLKDSALEYVWTAAVIGDRIDGWNGGKVPWKQCATTSDCLRDTSSGRSKFVVSFEIIGKYLAGNSRRDEWRIMKSEYELYHFNGGWLYNSKVHTRTRKQVDRELMQLRIMGDIRGLIEQRVFTYDKTHEIRYNIGGPTVLIPNVLFVFPSLIGCVLVLILWNPIKARDRREDGVVHSDADSGK